QQDAQDRGHRSPGDALGQRQLGIVLDAVTEDRLALGERSLGEALAVAEASASVIAAGDDRTRFATSRHDGLQFERALGALRQNDRTALGVEDDDRIPTNRLQEILFAVEVAEMMAGADKGQELLTGTRLTLAVKGQVPQGLVPGRARGRLDVHLYAGGRWLGIALVNQRLDDDRHLTELEQVALR